MSIASDGNRGFEHLRVRLLRMAGYAEPGNRYEELGKRNARIHWEFKVILSVLEEIAARKVDGYGPFRYDEMEDDWRWEIQSLYQDIERKFGRLKTLVRPNPVPEPRADELLEILSDLSVYSARAIQLIVRLEMHHEYIDHGSKRRTGTEDGPSVSNGRRSSRHRYHA